MAYYILSSNGIEVSKKLKYHIGIICTHLYYFAKITTFPLLPPTMFHKDVKRCED
jgi:coenzyme F420-reducing hydrogenase beta subunit